MKRLLSGCLVGCSLFVLLLSGCDYLSDIGGSGDEANKAEASKDTVDPDSSSSSGDNESADGGDDAHQSEETTSSSPSCSDRTQNGKETDVDCGGPDCPACEVGKSCSTDSDCATGLCSDEDTCELPDLPDSNTIYTGSTEDIEIRGITPAGEQAMTYALHGRGVEGIAVGPKGNIYSGGQLGEIHKIDPAGNKQWIYKGHLEGAEIKAVAVGPEGNIYSAGQDGIHKLTPEGNKVWAYKKETPPSKGGSLIAVDSDGAVYMGTEDFRVVKVTSDGSEAWKYPSNRELGPITALDIGPDGFIHGAIADGAVTKFRPDGVEIWTKSLGVEIVPIAVDSTGSIWVGNVEGEVQKLNENGQKQWSYTDHNAAITALSIGPEGNIYSGDTDGKIHKFSSSGQNQWVYEKISENIFVLTASDL